MTIKNEREEQINALMRSRAKLVEQRRALVKRDGTSDRNEGYSERIVAIQAAIEATDSAIIDERKLLAQVGELSNAYADQAPQKALPNIT